MPSLSRRWRAWRPSQRGPIFDGRGGIFFTALEGVAPLDGAVFTALRPERLPLEDAEVEAEIERLKALPLAEYEAQRELAASRLGVRLSLLDRLRSDGAKGGMPPILATLSKTKMKKVAREECERLLKQRYKEYVDNPHPDKERPLKDEVRSEMLEIQNLTPNAFDECWQKLGLEKWKAPGAPRLKKT